MNDVFVVADHILSPLGATTAENFSRLKKGIAGVRRQERPGMADRPFYASLFEPGGFAAPEHTKFELLLIRSISPLLEETGVDPADPGTIMILPTTKGNISLLEEGIEDPARFSLIGSGRRIAHHFGFVNSPVVISNACISGVLALITAMRLIR